jgi:hypothetical protein
MRRAFAEREVYGGTNGRDTASRIGWGAVLGGEAFDLEDWQKALKQTFRG